MTRRRWRRLSRVILLAGVPAGVVMIVISGQLSPQSSRHADLGFGGLAVVLAGLCGGLYSFLRAEWESKRVALVGTLTAAGCSAGILLAIMLTQA